MSGGLFVTLDAGALARLGDQVAAAGAKAPLALARAINHTGAKARTQMIRALAPQTGLKRRTVVKALRETKAGAGGLTYTIRSRGGDVGLKHFGARETATGVSSAPWNKRSVYGGSFMRAGWWPHRVTKANWNGQVFYRYGGKTSTYRADGRGRMDRFVKAKSGLFIPSDLENAIETKGCTAKAAIWRLFFLPCSASQVPPNSLISLAFLASVATPRNMNATRLAT